MNHISYELSSDGETLHVYDDTGTELNSSPITDTTAEWQFPSDIYTVIAQELRDEFQTNGLSDRALSMIVILADENRIQ